VGGFKKFLLRGNVVDLAGAVGIGAAFGALVTAFVAAFITPLVGVVTGAAGDFSERAFTAGDVTFPYGVFVQSLISFLIIAVVVYFFVVKPVQRLMDQFRTEPEIERPTKECPECLSQIPSAGIAVRVLHRRTAGHRLRMRQPTRADVEDPHRMVSGALGGGCPNSDTTCPTRPHLSLCSLAPLQRVQRPER